MQAELPAPEGYSPLCQCGYFFVLSRLVLPSLATFFNTLLGMVSAFCGILLSSGCK